MLWLLFGSFADAGVTVAVVEFTNAADDAALDALGKGLQSMLTTDLAGVEQIQLVERSRLSAIQNELKLAESDWVDPSTASKVGKLAGASHLLGGSFTVVGDTMRLDARVFDVQTGKVLLAEALTGERDAFFELEKDLVDQLIKTFRLELTPKERASVRRLHTADFEAFKEFSLGLAYFDDKQFDQALASLGHAVEADADFKLAKLTLEAYAELIQKMRARADALDADEAARERLNQLVSDRDDTLIASQLIELAGQMGSSSQRKRVAALHLLTLFYNSEFQHQDRFMRKRARDLYAQRYFAEAKLLWPQLPLVPRATTTFGPSMVHAPTFQADFERYIRILWDGVPGEPEAYWKKTHLKHVQRNISDELYVGYLAQFLWLDQVEQADFHTRSYVLRAQAGIPIDPSGYSDRKTLQHQARRLTRAGFLDRSTAVLKSLSDNAERGSDVRGFAQVIEKNAAFKHTLDGLDGLRLEYARLALAGGGDWMERRLESFADDGLQSLAQKRRLSNCSLDTNNHAPTWVDGHPVWTMQEDRFLYTGARSNLKRAQGIRYHRGLPRKPGGAPGPDSMLVLDGVPRSVVEIEFVLSYSIPADFDIGDRRSTDLVHQAPIVDVLFGWNDVRTPDVKDAVTKDVVIHHPPRGFAVRLHADRIELVERVAHPQTSRSFRAWEETVLQTEKLKKSERRTVSVRVQGTKVTVRVGSATMNWTAADVERGFYGLGFRGPGFAAISQVAVSQP